VKLSTSTDYRGPTQGYALFMAPGILIVDDHAVFRAQARALLEAGGYEVVGEATDGEGALEAVRELHPAVVLLDVQLPDRDGFSIADEIGNESAAPRVVFVSSRDAADYGTALESRPDNGFIHKPDLSPVALAELVGPPA
jgi:DNA-binding NarL/FixJ family response regulator